jgi:hypothetical protein
VWEAKTNYETKIQGRTQQHCNREEEELWLFRKEEEIRFDYGDMKEVQICIRPLKQQDFTSRDGGGLGF